MSANRRSWPLIGIVVAIALCGCAPAYHAYPNACIPYYYCPEPPLPYTTYGNCHCPTPITAEFLRQHGEIELQPTPDSTVVPENAATNSPQDPAEQ